MQTIESTSDLIETLNSYDGDDIWQDVIYGLDDLDQEQTEQEDPNGHSDVIVLESGAVIRYSESRREWYLD